jgi:RNA-binding protein
VIHHITFRAFAAETEDEGRVRDALGIFVPLDKITITDALGHYDNVIKILEATLKRKEGQAFFELLREQLPEGDLSRLRIEVEDRVDDNCELHLRLDKQAAYKGRVCLTDSTDAISVSAHMESYPAKREEAVRIARELL